MARKTAPAKKRPPRTDDERIRTKTHTRDRGPDQVHAPATAKGPKEDPEEWRVRAAGGEALDDREDDADPRP